MKPVHPFGSRDVVVSYLSAPTTDPVAARYFMAARWQIDHDRHRIVELERELALTRLALDPASKKLVSKTLLVCADLADRINDELREELSTADLEYDSPALDLLSKQLRKAAKGLPPCFRV